MLANKDAAGFLAPLARQACSLTAVPIHGHACHTPDALARTAAALGLETGVADTVDDALRRIADRHDTPDPVVLIVGSLYLAGEVLAANGELPRSEEHTSELQSLMRISYAVFCLKKKN